jgi:hypothetical protein
MQIGSQVRGPDAMLAAVSQHSEPERNALRNAQPVQFTKNWRDMVELAGTMDKTCGRIHDRLQAIQQMMW